MLRSAKITAEHVHRGGSGRELGLPPRLPRTSHKAQLSSAHTEQPRDRWGQMEREEGQLEEPHFRKLPMEPA